MAICTNSLSRGWSRTILILFQPFRLIFWLKMAFIVFFMHQLTNYNLFSQLVLGYLEPYLPEDPTQFNNYDQLFEKAADILPIIVMVTMVVIVFMIFMNFVKSSLRIIFLDGVYKGKSYFQRSFSGHFSQIVSYFLWNVVITLITFILILVIGGGLFALIWGTRAMEGDTTGLIISITLSIGLFFIMFFITILYLVLLEAIVLPLMLVKDVGILSAWGDALRLSFGNFWEFIGFVVIRVIIDVVVGILLLICGMILGFIMVLVVGMTQFAVASGSGVAMGQPEIFNNIYFTLLTIPLSFIINFFLLPLPVFQDAYAFCFIRDLTGDSEYEPGKHSLPKKEPPQTQSMDEPVLQTSQPPLGPVSFTEIPPETVEPESSAQPEEQQESEEGDNNTHDPPGSFPPNPVQ